MTTPAPAVGQVVTFYSYKGGTGRTMTLANLAWIMASSGLRVLAVDWDLESPGLHRYFHPFIADKLLRRTPGVIDMIRDYAVAAMNRMDHIGDPEWYVREAKIQRYAASLNWSFQHGGMIDLVVAGQQDAGYSATVSTFDWPSFYERHNGRAFLEALRADMKANYDAVLIDSRTGLSDAAGICTVLLPDVVVNCFTLATQSIEGAVAVAESISRQREREPVRILPVPMRVEDAEQVKLELGRDLARHRFAPFLWHLAPHDLNRYWGQVEIPYKTFYAYEEILAQFGDRAEQRDTLLAAYERLTGVLTDGRVSGAAPMEESTRRRWLAEFERPGLDADGDVTISYASPDRAWAEWIADELAGAGLGTRLRPVDVPLSVEDRAELNRELAGASRVVAVLSYHYVTSPYAADAWAGGAGRDQTFARPRLVPVRVDAARLPFPYHDRLPVDLTGTDARTAGALVRDALALPRYRQPLDAGDARFPGPVASVWNVAQRAAGFVGRASELEEIRDRLVSNPGQPLALTGLAGVGKTQLVAEYAHRFSRVYDVVWWIQADDLPRIQAGLAELGAAMGLPAGNSIAETTRTVLDALRRGDPHPRWLLIFDDVEDLSQDVRDLMPQGAGHVLVTTAEGAWDEPVAGIEIRVFSREESIGLLCQRVKGLSEKDADELAARLGDLPLAVEQAAAYLRTTAMPVRQYLNSLDTPGLLRILDDPAAVDHRETVASTWLVTLERLRDDNPAAARLFELCSFYAPEPIPVAMLLGERFASFLASYDPALRDPILQGLVTGDLGRYALARVDPERNSIHIHPLVRLVVREQLDEPETMRRHAQAVLASANPGDPDKPANWPRYRELWPHVRACGLVDSTEAEARQLVVDAARYLYRLGDYQNSRRLAEDALTAWSATLDLDDPLLLRLRFHLANALRAQTEYAEAYAIDLDVHARQQRVHGADHPYTLMTARSLGVDLRAHGEYHEAERLDRETLQRCVRTFGDDRGETLVAENNLAVSLRWIGRFREAADLDLHILERRTARFGEDDPATLGSASNYGRDLRDLGDLWRSRSLLGRTLAAQRRTIGESHPETLRTAKHLALTLRQLGRFVEAHRLAVDTARRYERALAPDHPDALSCELTLATTHSAIGENDVALALARDIHVRYEQVLGPNHASTLSCVSDLGVFLLKAGDVTRARPLAEEVYSLLRDDLGGRHPYVLQAAVNLANIWFAADDVDAALELDTEAYVELTRALGAEHPDTVSAAVNLALSREQSGESEAGSALYDEAFGQLVELLGGDNPRVAQVRRRERLNLYIEPASL